MFKQSKAWMAIGMLLTAGGCAMQCPVQKVENSGPERENQTPVIVDQAMQLRNWERSTALYGNGNVVAGPTGFVYQPRWNQPEAYYIVEETPLFVGQAALIPIPLVMTPPWTPKLYSGVTVEPSYTAMPSVPARAETTPVAAPTTQP